MRTVDDTVEDTVEKSVKNVMNAHPKIGIMSLLPVRLPPRWQRLFGSLRTQLILWNFVALALLVGGLGVVCRYAIYSYLLQSVDHDLDNRIDMYTRPPRKNHGPPGEPFGKFGKMPPFGLEHGRGPDGEHGPGPEGRGKHPFGEHPPDEHGPDGMGKHFGGPPPGDFHGGKRGPHSPDEDSQFRPHQYNSKGQSVIATDTRPVWDKAGLTLALGGKTVYNTVMVDEEPIRVVSSLGYNLKGERGAVQSGYPLKEVYRALSGIDTVLLLIFPLGLLGAGWMGTALTNRVLRRVHWMTQAAGRIGTEPGANGFSRRLPVAGSDEFAELAVTFNGMLGRLDGAFQKQRQLLELQQRFTADASHELKTPLTIIKGRAGMTMGRDTTDERSRHAFQEISEAADTMSQLVQDLLLLARSDEGQMGQDRRELLVGEVLETARRQALQDNSAPINLRVEPESLTVLGNQAELARLFRNLLDNAVRYTPPDGDIEVKARREQAGVVITVRDTGSGIAPEHLPHLGTRFHRVDASRTRPTGGTGLGLSICRGIVEAHGGTIAFESQLGTGTTVTVRLRGC